MNRKIYVVGSATDYANWMLGELTREMKEADLAVFTGGEDVNPAVYYEPIGKYTSFNKERDKREIEAFHALQHLEIPMVGICRGAQLLCALSGGVLVQDQDNPLWEHEIYTSDGIVIPITSTHHQAMYPYKSLLPNEYQVLGWTHGISDHHLDGRDMEISSEPFKEVEICYFKDTNALGIQGHPEYIWSKRNAYKPTFEYLHGLLDKLLTNKIQ